jgi:hypothetical protein
MYAGFPGLPDAQIDVDGHEPARQVENPASFSQICDALSQQSSPQVMAFPGQKQTPLVQTCPGAHSLLVQQASTEMQLPLHNR